MSRLRGEAAFESSVRPSLGTALTPAQVYSYTVPQAVFDGVGNILSSQDSIMGTWAFQYDTLNRLVTGSAATGTYANQIACWSYDDFGNRTMQSLQTSACSNAPGVPVDRSSSTGWDAEGRICAFETPNGLGGETMVGYLYDANGTRVAKGTITSMTCNPGSNGFQLTESYVLGPSGEELTQLNGSGVWQRTNVYDGGKQLATYDTLGLHFQLSDPLGTRRLQTDSAGQPETDIQSRGPRGQVHVRGVECLPYGDGLSTPPDQYAPPTADDATPLHFTGKERDTESGNDYFGARYYMSAMGRWLSPDWSAKVEPVPYSKLDNPQTLNLYAYLMDNPLASVDADGHGGGTGSCNSAQDSKHPCTPATSAQQNVDGNAVGKTTVGSLEKTMTHEDGSLSTPKGGDPTELAKGKTALANAIINGAESKHPPLVATPTVPASSQDAQIMRDAYTNRANGGADPVQGRIFYGTSHEILTSRPACIGCKARETVFAKFGPFNDSVGRGQQTYIYIYNNPK